MTEIRTTSRTGGQKGTKDERMDLLPRKGQAAIARVFAFGAQKYADHNWRRGYEWSKSIAALDRHFSAFVDGETYDEESGLPHLAHAGFHVLVMLTWLEEQGEGPDNLFDDRWPHSMARASLLEAFDEGGPLAELLEAFGVSEETFVEMLAQREPEEEPEVDEKPPVFNEEVNEQTIALAVGLPIPMPGPEIKIEFKNPKLRSVLEIQDSINRMFNGYTPPRLEM